MTETHTQATNTPAQGDAARGQVPPPEAAMDDATRAPVPEPEGAAAMPTPEAAIPPSQEGLPVPSQAITHAVPIQTAKVENLILLPAVLANAEKNLAAHIGAHIDPILEKNLMLNVSSNLEKGTTNLVLSFTGDMVNANPAVLGEQVIASLHALPAMQTLIADHHHTPIAEFHDGTLHVVVPHLSTAHYAHLIQALAAGV